MVEAIEAQLAGVASLDQDRILRSLLGLIGATLRTNAYRTDDRRQPAHRLGREARPAPDRRPARAAPALRDLGVFAARRGCPPALRLGGPRRPALVGPARGLPHRDPRPGQGADGEERGHRADRRQGRLRREGLQRHRRRPADLGPQAAVGGPRRLAGRGHRLLPHLHLLPARSHRQLRHRHRRGRGRRATDRCAAADPPLRRRRPLPRGRRRQGHRDVQRHRQRDRDGLRLLARRRVRLRRLGRLRPQGDGDHRPRRVGVGQVPLPRTGPRHPDAGLHRRRHRRHVRRRVRQRDAAVRAHPAGRRVRPPAHLPRPRPERRAQLRRAAPDLRPAALVVGRVRHVAHLPGRRHLPAHPQVDPDQPAGPRSCSASPTISSA